MSYSSVFGGTTVAPANPSFLALSIAATTALVWPLESTAGVPFAAAWINVTATATGLQLQMPPGLTGSNGAVSIIANVGTDSFTVTDTSGNQITPITAGQVWVITLTSNATTNGTWMATQLGATVSNANAGALAGSGLVANGTQLQLSFATTTSASTSLAIGSSSNGSVLVYDGSAAGTWSLDTIGSGAAVGTVFAFLNQSAYSLTFTSAGGNLINGATTLVIPPNAGGFLIAGASTWSAVSYGTIFPSLTVANGAMTVDTSGNLVANSLTSTTTFAAAGGVVTISSSGTINAAQLNLTGEFFADNGSIGSESGTINAQGFTAIQGIEAAQTITARGFTTLFSNGTISCGNLIATITGTLGAVTVTSLASSGIVSGTTIEPSAGVLGITTGSAAAAGLVGEVITTNFANVTLLGTGVVNTLANVSLTAGDWDVRADAYFVFSSGAVSYINLAISTTGSFPGFNNGLSQSYIGNPPGSGVAGSLVPCQVNLAASQSVAFLYQAVYSSGTIVAQGFIQARRMR